MSKFQGNLKRVWFRFYWLELLSFFVGDVAYKKLDTSDRFHLLVEASWMKGLTNCLEIFPLRPRTRQGIIQNDLNISEHNWRQFVIRKRQKRHMFVLLMKCDCFLALCPSFNNTATIVGDFARRMQLGASTQGGLFLIVFFHWEDGFNGCSTRIHFKWRLFWIQALWQKWATPREVPFFADTLHSTYPFPILALLLIISVGIHRF